MNYRGPYRVRVSQKPLPAKQHSNDAIVRVTRSCVCGSDLHTYHGLVPGTRVGTTFGHEFVGVVEEIGYIACGQCAFCKQELYGNCHESNPAATAAGGFFGYSHTAGYDMAISQTFLQKEV
jgi:threonine dehydrogenase-like Zn-dependent dehydrogenase